MNNFDRTYIITVPHRLAVATLTFWSDDEIKSYAQELNADWDIETVSDAIDCIGSDLHKYFVIRNAADCSDAWNRAAHQASEVRAELRKIAEIENIKIAGDADECR